MKRKPQHYFWPVVISSAFACVVAFIVLVFLHNLKG